MKIFVDLIILNIDYIAAFGIAVGIGLLFIIFKSFPRIIG